MVDPRRGIPREKASEFYDDEDKFVSMRFVEYILNNTPENSIASPINPHGGDTIYWYDEETGIFEPTGISRAEQLVQDILGEDCTTRKQNEVTKQLMVKTYVKREDFFTDHPEIIVFKNGAYNLETGMLEPHSPEHRALSSIPHRYNPEARCPVTVKVLVTILGSEIVTYQEWLGYHLYRLYPFHKCALYIGTGSNGKSQLLILISHLVGRENISTVSLYELTTDKFATADLYRKHANLAPDVGSTELKYTGRFKALSGEDSIRAQEKYGKAFDFYNYAKMNFACNQLPSTPDNSDAFFRRFLPFKLRNIFIDKSTLEKHPELRENPYIHEKIPRVMDKACTREELEGLVVWALRGLRRLLRNGEFTNSPSTEEIREYYTRQSNPVLGFVTDCIAEDKVAETPKDEVYRAYVEYCRANGFVAEVKNQFTQKLSGEVMFQSSRPRIKGNRVQCYKGIRLVSDSERSGQGGQNGQGNLNNFQKGGMKNRKGCKYPDHSDHPDQKKLEDIIRKILTEDPDRPDQDKRRLVLDILGELGEAVPEEELCIRSRVMLSELREFLKDLMGEGLVRQPKPGLWELEQGDGELDGAVTEPVEDQEETPPTMGAFEESEETPTPSPEEVFPIEGELTGDPTLQYGEGDHPDHTDPVKPGAESTHEKTSLEKEHEKELEPEAGNTGLAAFEEVLFKKAREILRGNNWEMYQTGFWDELTRRGYNRMQADKVLRGCGDFKFWGLKVRYVGDRGDWEAKP